MKTFVALVVTMLAVRASADTLSDVRTVVGRLSAKAPLRATYSAEQHVKSAGRFANDKVERTVSAEVAQDASGISITVPQTLLDRVSRARSGGDQSAQDLIGVIKPIVIVEALNFRDALLEMLKDATLTREERGVLHGRPARKLTLQLKPRTEKKPNTIRIGSVKGEDRLSLWIGDDAMPLAAERVQTTTAGFMFLHGTFTGRSTYTFTHAADRLIVARLETNDSGSGMGQDVESSGVQTLTLH